jgi:hypothetical protein
MKHLIIGLVVLIGILGGNGLNASYDLQSVKGIGAFSGSAAARQLLTTNGFVVSDPAFRQIFEAYIESPQIAEASEHDPLGESLPVFITPDSAWHTYHVLMEEGVRELEEVQSRRLTAFSRELLAAAEGKKLPAELIGFLSVGLALQDSKFRETLAPNEKRIVEALRSGDSTVLAPIGFPLSPTQFRAQSFYTQSPELSDYFAARQWYAGVVFRLSNSNESRWAIELIRLLNSQPKLLEIWKRLSEPFDALLKRVGADH